MAKVPTKEEASTMGLNLFVPSKRGIDDFGGPVHPGYLKLQNFVNETGRAFYPNVWTGQECEGSWVLPLVMGGGWAGSQFEYDTWTKLHKEKSVLSLVTNGYTDKEARRILNKPPTEDDFFSRGELMPVSRHELKTLNDSFQKSINCCDQIAGRRKVAIVDSLRHALGLGQIPTLYLDLDGSYKEVEKGIWYQEPDWIKQIVHSRIDCSRQKPDGTYDFESRWILVEEKLARSWLASVVPGGKSTPQVRTSKNKPSDGTALNAKDYQRKINIESVLAIAKRLDSGHGHRVLAKAIIKDGSCTNYKLDAVRKILSGTYSASIRLGIAGYSK